MALRTSDYNFCSIIHFSPGWLVGDQQDCNDSGGKKASEKIFSGVLTPTGLRGTLLPDTEFGYIRQFGGSIWSASHWSVLSAVVRRRSVLTFV
jgi:hypothetical protein